jgi:flagellar secretion chaperone FliS
MNGYAAAAQAYTETSVLSAPPERLVVMLYDGAGRFLARAAAAVREGDTVGATEPLQRAQAILDELLATLDPAAGPLTERLESIYLFSKRTLTEAQLARDPEPIERVASLLGVLRGAWNEIADNARSEAPAGDLA